MCIIRVYLLPFAYIVLPTYKACMILHYYYYFSHFIFKSIIALQLLHFVIIFHRSTATNPTLYIPN